MKKILPIPILMTLLLCITFAYSESTFISPNQVKGGVYTKAEVNATVENALTSKYDKTTGDSLENQFNNTKADLSGNYSTTTQMNSAIAAATAECQAKTWTPLSMANGNYTGEVIVDTVAASQTVYNVVYSSSTGWAAAKADTDSTLPALGMALETGTGDKKILLRGIVKNTSWNFTRGNLIYVSTATAGAITAVKPSASGNRIQPVGVALSADTVLFNPISLWIEI